MPATTTDLLMNVVSNHDKNVRDLRRLQQIATDGKSTTADSFEEFYKNMELFRQAILRDYDQLIEDIGLQISKMGSTADQIAVNGTTEPFQIGRSTVEELDGTGN